MTTGSVARTQTSPGNFDGYAWSSSITPENAEAVVGWFAQVDRAHATWTHAVGRTDSPFIPPSDRGET